MSIRIFISVFFSVVTLFLDIAFAKEDVFNMPAGLTSVEFVTIGNPGNASYSYDGFSYGAVDYNYQIGKYEITAGQYCEFLNAVAKTDTYGLYNTYMNYDANPSQKGCNIKRTGSSGNYSYTVATNWANRPVNYVSWADGVRFVNWLTNGQPIGSQNLTTTEDGSYYINGHTDYSTLMLSVTRKSNAKYVLPSEDEWCKAAFYDPNKPGGAGYWTYTTGTNAIPSNDNIPTGTNNANYVKPSDYTIGSPYYRTPVGTFTNSESPYGTYDQGGNVEEWNDSKFYAIEETGCGLIGGAFDTTYDDMSVNWRYYLGPQSEFSSIGFRVAYIPEPGCFMLLFSGAVTLIVNWRRRLNG
jgi:formylglycine-generating enzyme